MYYILNEKIALRSYRLIPFSYVRKGEQFISGLREEEFDRLLLADGSHDLPENTLSAGLVERGLMRPCEKDGAELSEWQCYRHYDNHAFPAMNLQVTSACNFNCRHCFNASGNVQHHYTMPYADAVELLDQAKDCGILALTITGGEPLIHPDIRRIIEAIYQRDMYVNELNTNGYYLDAGFLDFMKSIGARPRMKISFDGIGFHDWMRDFEGAEPAALQAIERAVNAGFTVIPQVNVNRRNIGSIPETLEILDSMGASMANIIRTTEVPRWLAKGADYTFGMTEYFDAMLDVFAKYAQQPHNMVLRSWQFITMNVRDKVFALEPVTAFSQKGARRNQPLCKGTRSMVAVGANGTVYPCMQLSGTFEARNIHLGNVKDGGLKPLLQQSPYLDCVCQTLQDRLDRNEKCRTCPYLKWCAGGCPALAMADPQEQSMLGIDRSKCAFFENRYDLKAQAALPGYTNLTPIDI